MGEKKSLKKMLLIAVLQVIASWLFFSFYLSMTSKGLGFGKALVSSGALIFLAIVGVLNIIITIVRYKKLEQAE
jgi:hypothetical protein